MQGDYGNFADTHSTTSVNLLAWNVNWTIKKIFLALLLVFLWNFGIIERKTYFKIKLWWGSGFCRSRQNFSKHWLGVDRTLWHQVTVLPRAITFHLQNTEIIGDQEHSPAPTRARSIVPYFRTICSAPFVLNFVYKL